MRTITLKIPDDMDDSLEAIAAQRHASKSAVVRSAIQDVLARESPNPAALWVESCRGILSPEDISDDDRMAYLIAKHVH